MNTIWLQIVVFGVPQIVIPWWTFVDVFANLGQARRLTIHFLLLASSSFGLLSSCFCSGGS